MPTTVADLLVKVGADTTEAETKLAQFATGLEAIVGVGVAVTAALFEITKLTAEYGEQLEKTSQKTGISVENLSALAYAASLTDVGFEGLTTGLKFLNKNLDAAQNGAAKQVGTFLELGVAVKTSTGELKSTEQVLVDVAESFKNMEDGPEKVALAIQLFGRSGTQLIPFLNQGAAGLQALSEEAAKLGVVMGEDDAKASEQFNDDLRRLGQAAKGVGMAIGTDLMPYFQKFVDVLVDYAPAGIAVFNAGLLTIKQLAIDAAFKLQQMGVQAQLVISGGIFSKKDRDEAQATLDLLEKERASLKQAAVDEIAAGTATSKANLAAATSKKELAAQSAALKNAEAQEATGHDIVRKSMENQEKALSGLHTALSRYLSLQESSKSTLDSLAKQDLIDKLKEQTNLEDKLRIIRAEALNAPSDGLERQDKLKELIDLTNTFTGDTANAQDDVKRLAKSLTEDLRSAAQSTKDTAEKNIGVIRDVLKDGIVSASELAKSLDALKQIGPIPIQITGIQEALEAVLALQRGGGAKQTSKVQSFVNGTTPPPQAGGGGSQVIAPSGDTGAYGGSGGSSNTGTSSQPYIINNFTAPITTTDSLRTVVREEIAPQIDDLASVRWDYFGGGD